MKLNIQSPALNITIENDAGQTIYHYSADNVIVTLDTEAAVKAVQEIATQIDALGNKPAVAE